MSKTILKLFLIAAFLVPAHYGVSEANDRTRHQKINTESATVVAPGEIEIDLSYTYIDQIGKYSGAFSSGSFGPNGVRRSKMRYHEAMLGVTYGLMDNMDIGARMGWADIKDRERPFGDKHGKGFTDLEVFGKYRFYQDDNGLSFAYVAGLEIPIAKATRTGKLRIGQKYWSFNQQLVLTKDFNEDWTMNADVGYRLPFGRTRTSYSPEFGREVRNTRGTLESNVALGYTGFASLQPVIEANYAHEWINRGNDSDTLGFTVGAIVPVLDKHRLRVGVQRDFWGRNAVQSYTWVAGLTMGF